MAGKAKDELSPRAKAWVIGVVAVAIAAWIFWPSSDDDGGGGGGGGGSREVMELSAFNVCKDFVRDELKAPSSATFRNFFEDDGEVRVFNSDPTYRVVSSVDAENSFGAKLRTDFECTVLNVDGDRWRLTNLVLDD